MRSLFSKRGQASGSAGVYIHGSGIAIVEVDRSDAENPKIIRCDYVNIPDGQSANDVLGKVAHSSLPVVAVLPSASYQLLLVEAPEVAAEELRAAVRWRIRDLVDFHIDDAVIDVVQMPEQARGGQLQMMYAVAARADDITAHVGAVTAAGRNIDVVDIQELAQRNIAALLDEDEYGVALLCLDENQGLLTLTRQSTIYLTRRIEIGSQSLAGDPDAASELIESLALEVRRSLDYFESHYAQKPIQSLYVSGFAPAERNALGLELSTAVKPLDLSTLLPSDLDSAIGDEFYWLPALGAALRVDPVTL